MKTASDSQSNYRTMSCDTNERIGWVNFEAPVRNCSICGREKGEKDENILGVVAAKLCICILCQQNYFILFPFRIEFRIICLFSDSRIGNAYIGH